ncbi:hypothetical protein EUGRSUZ_G03202 [Eucalyptus grandis]|uniref:Alpha/beta hydrolase fold-3 domain-containing protein n=2 Tax=Eucalyptus grandis TaxID=71139 RepID=A0A059BJ07_EUCGR|nr:hypothetical protein EUGRSUZ_G03202 [Eucalyptus grandis]
MVRQMMMVDEVPGWLRVYEDGSVDRTWTGPPEAKFMAEPVAPHEEFIDGVAVRDVVTDRKSGRRVRIYLPEDIPEADSAKLPVILHFHGGGFCISQADWFMYYNTYTKLAASARAICVSAYLRLAPENRLPAAMEDAYAALEWLISVARGESREPWLEDHADFSRVFLIGDSSGGNVVHEVARRAGEVGRGDPDPPGVRPGGAEPVRAGASRDAVPESGHGGQVPQLGAARGRDQGPPADVPDGAGGAGVGGAEVAAGAVLRGGEGPGAGHRDGVLQGDEGGEQGGGAAGEPRDDAQLLPEQDGHRYGPRHGRGDRPAHGGRHRVHQEALSGIKNPTNKKWRGIWQRYVLGVVFMSSSDFFFLLNFPVRLFAANAKKIKRPKK